MCLWSIHLSKNVFSNFRNESMLDDGSFIKAGRLFQIVGPEILNGLGPTVVVLVLGMYSCYEVADRNCLRPGIAEITMQSVARWNGLSSLKNRYIRVAILKIILGRTGNQWRLRKTGVMWLYFGVPVTNRAAALWTLLMSQEFLADTVQ